MNLNRKDVLRLKKDLIQQLACFIDENIFEADKRIPLGQVSQEFWFNDGKDQDQHTDDHGQGLSEENVEYLFRQADGTFEETFQVVQGKGKTYWVMKPRKPIESAATEAAGATQEANS